MVLPRDGGDLANFNNRELATLGISELRCLNPEVVARSLWASAGKEDDEGEQRWVSACFFGGSTAVASIRFGSPLEQALYYAMRIIVFLDLLFTPFVVCFDVVYPLRRTLLVLMFDLCLCAAFGMGLLARFNTSFVNTRTCEESTKLNEIKTHMLSQWSVRCDIVALCAAPCLYLRGDWSFLGFLRLVKSWRLPKSAQRVMLLGSDGDEQEALFSLFFGIYAAAHLYACTWFQAKVHSDLGMGHEWSSWNGWAVDVFTLDKVDQSALSVPLEYGTLDDLLWCYMRSFRDGAYMLVSWAGPNAISMVELVVIGILGPLSGLIMAYINAAFVSSLEQSMMNENLFNERMGLLRTACKSMMLPDQLRERICRYYSFLSLRHIGSDAQELFAQLSTNLTCEIRMVRMRDVITNADIFQSLSCRIILLLVQTFTEQAFAPGDLVVRKGEVADCMYIILHGSVSVFLDETLQQCLGKMNENDVFGELCFLEENSTRNAWICADSYLVLWRFDKESFDALIAANEETKHEMLTMISKRAKNYQGKGGSTAKTSSTASNWGARGKSLKPDMEDGERTPLMSFNDDESPCDGVQGTTVVAAKDIELEALTLTSRAGQRNGRATISLNGSFAQRARRHSFQMLPSSGQGLLQESFQASGVVVPEESCAAVGKDPLTAPLVLDGFLKPETTVAAAVYSTSPAPPDVCFTNLGIKAAFDPCNVSRDISLMVARIGDLHDEVRKLGSYVRTELDAQRGSMHFLRAEMRGLAAKVEGVCKDHPSPTEVLKNPSSRFACEEPGPAFAPSMPMGGLPSQRENDGPTSISSVFTNSGPKAKNQSRVVNWLRTGPR